MKILKLIAFILFSSNSFSQSYEWALKQGGTSSEIGHAVITGSDGSVYTTGTFVGTVDFDPSISGTYTLTSFGGSNDIFISKVDANGNFMWAHQIGGSSGYDRGHTISIDALDNIYIAGRYIGNVDFDPSTSSTILSGNGSSDSFFAKYDSNGNFIYAKSIASPTQDDIYKMYLDNNGNIYISGWFELTTDMDPNSGVANLTSNGGLDLFFAKYDNSGNYIWAKSMGSSNHDVAWGIETDAFSNVYITGYFQGSVDFDPSPVGSSILTSNGAQDIYIAKFDSNGNHIWAKKIGSSAYDTGLDLAIDFNNNVFVTGIFSGTADFDAGVGTASKSTNGGQDNFIVKYTSAGNFVWCNTSGSSSNEISWNIYVDDSTNVYTTGLFYGTVDFDASASTFNLTSAGGKDVFFTKYSNNNGSFIWAKKVGGTSDDEANSIHVDNNNVIYITGTFSSTADFDPHAGIQNLSASGGTDVFIAKYSACFDPTLPTISASLLNVCSSSPTTLSVTSGSLNSATAWTWYSGSCGGTLVGTGTSVVVSPTINTTYYVRGEGSCVSTGPCSSLSIAVTPITTANAGLDQNICLTSTTLNANTPISGTGVWSIISGSGSITDLSQPNTTITGLTLGANTVLRWTITNGSCTSYDEVTLIKNDLPITINPANSTVCSGSITTLTVQTSFNSCALSALPTNLQQNLVAWYPFCGNANDYSGNNYHGTPQNGAILTTDRFGNANSAYSFDGINDRIFINNNFFNAGWNGFTMSAWVYFNSISNPVNGNGTHVIFNTSAHNGIAVAASWGFSGKYHLYAGNGTPATSWNVISSPTSVQNVVATTWKHITLVKNGNAYSLYVNGILDQSWASAVTVQSYLYKMYLGSNDPLASNEALNGKLDDIRIYNKALSSTEITQTFNDSQSYNFLWSTSETTQSINVAPTTSTTYSVIATNDMNGCSSTAIATVTVVSPVVANAGLDQNICETSVTLAGNTPATGTGTWTRISGTGTIAGVNNPNATVSGITNNSIFRWTINNPPCPASIDDVTVFKITPTIANAGSDQNVCATSTTLAGNAPTVGTGSWSVVSGTATITDPTLRNTTVTALTPGTYTVLRWTIANAPCTPSADDVTIRSTAAPTAADTGTNIDICGTTVTLAGNTPTTGTGTWTRISGTGTITGVNNPNATVSGITSNSIFRWTINNAPCPVSIDDVTIFKITAPVANAGSDQIICFTSTTLAANTPSSGTGVWSVVSGSGTITDSTQPNTTINGLTLGANTILQWTINNGICPPSADDLTIFKSDSPITIDPVNTVACSGFITTLTAVAPFGNNACTLSNLPTNLQQNLVAWYPFCGNANDESGNGNNGTVTNATLVTDRFGNANSAYSFNGTSDFITVADANSLDFTNSFSYSIWLNIPDYTVGTSGILRAAFGKERILNGTGFDFASVTTVSNRWGIGMMDASSNVAVYSNTALPLNTWKHLAMTYDGTSVKLYTDGVLVTTQATTLTLLNSTFPLYIGKELNNSSRMYKGKIDDFGLWNRVLTATEINQLYNNEQSYSFLWSTSETSQSITIAPTTTSTYSVTATNDINGCSSTAVATVTVVSPVVANAGPDQSICETTVTLAGNTPTTGTGTWTRISGTGTITGVNNPNATVSGITSNSIFRWTINNAPCPASIDDVTIFKITPTIANAGSDQNVCATSATLAGNAPTIGTGSWSVVSGTATITDPTIRNTTVTVLTPGTYTVLRWTIANAPCTPSTDDITITSIESPTTADAGNNQTVCSATTTLAANTATVGTGAWSVVSGTATVTSLNNPTSTVTGLVQGSAAVLRWTIANAPCTSSTDDVTITRVNNPTTADAGANQTICSATTNLAGNTVIVGTGIWNVVSGTATITSLNNPTSTVTGLVQGSAAVLRWTIANAPCTSSTDDVTIIRVNDPTAADAGSNQDICGTTVTLSGNSPTVGTGTWTRISGTGTITGVNNTNATVSGITGASSVFRWTIANAPCTSSADDVTVFKITPTTANAGPDQNVCATSATLAGNAPTVGTGSWSIVSGNATITDPTLRNTTVTTLSPGTYTVLRWTIDNAPCAPSTDDVTIRSTATPTTADAGSNQIICSATTTLAANTAVIGTGIWSVVSGTATVTSLNNPASTVTGLVQGLSAVLRWSISNAPCTTSIDDVTITRVNNPTVADAGSNQTVCSATTTLAANTATVGTGSWSVVSGTASITSLNSPTSTVTGLVQGSAAVLRWTIANSPCASLTDDVTITRVNDPTAADAGPNQDICGTTVTLAGNTPTVGTGTWTLVSGTGTITGINSPNATVSGITGTNSVFRWTIANAPCTSSIDDVTINRITPTVADAGTNQNICGSTTTLAANTAVVGTGTWSVVIGTATITSLNNPTSTVTGLVAGTDAVLRWTITNAPCTPSTDDVTIRSTAATIADAGNNQIVCSGSITLSANTAVIGTGTWSVVSGTATVTSLNNPASAVTGITAGSNVVLRWSIANAPCTTSIDDVTITRVNNTTLADAGSNQNICLSSTTLAGNTPTAGTGTWSVVSGTATVTSLNNPVSTVTGLVQGSSAVLRWTIANAPCTSSSDDVTINYSNSVTAADAGVNQTICATSTTLAANTAVVGSGTWSVVSGGGSFASINNPSSIISNLNVGNNILRWTIANGVCPPSSDDITIRVDAQPTIANAGNNLSVCGSSVNLNANVPTIGTGTWSVVTSTGNFNNTNQANTIISNLVTGQTIIKWTINNGVCTSSQDELTIQSYASPSNSSAGSNQTICATSTTLSANTPTVGTGTWSVISGNATIAAINNPSSGISAIGVGDNILRWTIENGTCSPSTSEVTIHVDALQTIANAGQDQIICNGTSTLTGNTPIVGTGTWSVVSGTGTFANSNLANTAITGLSNGINILKWQITNGVCSSSSDEISISVLPPLSLSVCCIAKPIPCGSATGSATANVTGGSGNYSYLWNSVPVQTSNTISNIKSGTYLVTVSDVVTNCFETISVTINDTDAPLVEIVSSDSDNIICRGDSILLTVSNEGSYLWSNNETNKTIVIKESGNYFVEVTSPTGCRSISETLEIIVGDTLKIDLVSPEYYGGHNVSMYQATDGSINSNVSGGFIPYQYNWSNGEISENIDGLPVGGYELIVIDKNNCKDSAKIQLTGPDPLQLPRVFTPNGDGYNDFFVIKGVEVFPGTEVTIYNRWGNVVFESKDYKNEWKGQGKNGDVMNGTYFVVMIAKNPDGTTIMLDGYVELRRENK